jgi:hypothetical protein
MESVARAKGSPRMFPTWIPFRLPYLELSIFCSEGEPYDTIGELATKRRVSSTEGEGERVYNPLESGKSVGAMATVA